MILLPILLIAMLAGAFMASAMRLEEPKEEPYEPMPNFRVVGGLGPLMQWSAKRRKELRQERELYRDIRRLTRRLTRERMFKQTLSKAGSMREEEPNQGRQKITAD